MVGGGRVSPPLTKATAAPASIPSVPAELFSVVIPPPKVTGSLRMVHGFETALIDTIVCFQRLHGKNVLCLPDTDHALIAVQSILERQVDIQLDAADGSNTAEEDALQARFKAGKDY